MTGKAHIEYCKRRAKKLKKDLGIIHADALEEIARQEGFSSWKAFLSHHTNKTK